MNKHWILQLMLSLVCLSGYAQITNNLNLVWADEFNGNTLDASKWKVPPAWNRQDGSYWSADNYQMTGNGQLKLSVTEKNGKVYCGALRTHNLFDKKYGYFEVRCKVPQMQGGWAAFWMMPYQNKPGNAGNDGTEIDIFESINGWKGQINHALHWDGYGPEHKHEAKKMQRPDLYDDNYHIFSVMWTPKEYIFYIDNQETWRTSTAGVADVKQYLKLTLEVSGYTWPGDWKKQKVKTIHWLIDYVRVYDYEPISEENVNLEFTSLSNNQTFKIGDQVQMHTDVTGTLSQLDELKFFTKKGNEPYVLRRSSNINSERTYWYNWFPTEAGNYKLKVEGYKNGIYVTSLVTNATIDNGLAPFKLEFGSLISGSTYNVGDNINIGVQLSGDLSDADEIQYLSRKEDGVFSVQKTTNLTGLSEYNYNWIATEAGKYSFRVTALKNGKYITHVVAGDVAVLETVDPLTLSFTSLNSGDTYNVGDPINMNTELSGDLSDADEIQYLVKKGDGVFEVQKSEILTGLSGYDYSWTPAEAGNYSLRITALKNGKYVTQVVVNDISVEEVLDPISLKFSLLNSGDTYKVGDLVNIGIELFGDLSDADEVQYLARKEDGVFEVQKSEILTGLSAYSYNWTATEAGVYSFRVTALKDGKYITHVIAGGVIVEKPIDPLSINFTSVNSGSTYKVLDSIPMNVELFGNLADADELQFFIRKGTDEFAIQHTVNVSNASNYNYNWVPSESGTYSLRVAATIDGVSVVHTVVGNVVVEDPLTIKYLAVRTESAYKMGEKVKMHLKLSGDYGHVNQLKFIVQKTGKPRVVAKTLTVSSGQDIYRNRWTPTEPGNYRLRVNAYSNGAFVGYVQANIIVENAIKFSYRFLENGQSFIVGDYVKMNVRALGDMSKADQIKFVVQKIGGNNQVIRVNKINPSKKAYNCRWVPKQAGNYKLKVEAYKNGVFVTIVVANISVTNTRSFQFRASNSNEVDEAKNIDISAYPNPSIGVVNVDLGALTDAKIKVSNSSGQMIYQEFGISGIHQFELKGAPGLYFMEVKSEIGSQFFKLIKK